MASAKKCVQCGKPAVVAYNDGNTPLCVEHHLMMQQATYLETSRHAATLNFLSQEIAQAQDYILPPVHYEIPSPPFIGSQLTLNNINVSNSTIGAINTGTIQQLDASITMFQGEGKGEIAGALKDLTQAIHDSNEINATTKNEVAEQLAFLVAQVEAKPEQRSRGIIKSVLSGIGPLLTNTAALATLWSTLQPLIEKALS